MADACPLSAIPEGVGAIARRLREAGHEAWYVGGAVRDVLLAALRPDLPRRVGDFDITTSATPDEVMRLFDSVGTMRNSQSSSWPERLITRIS